MNNLWMLTLADAEDVASTEGQPLPATDQTAATENGTIADGSPAVKDEQAASKSFLEKNGMIIMDGSTVCHNVSVYDSRPQEKTAGTFKNG